MKMSVIKPKVTSVSYVLQFGKYKGWTIDQVLLEKPSYIEWVIDKEILDLSEEVLHEVEERLYRDRYDDFYDYFLNDEPPY